MKPLLTPVFRTLGLPERRTNCSCSRVTNVPTICQFNVFLSTEVHQPVTNADWTIDTSAPPDLIFAIMSLSTTSTAVYILSKYSRAHQSSTASGTQDENAEWQHFTNPVIRLVLDIKKSSNGELESYRVRILWSINAARGPDSMDVDQQEVCFVSICFVYALCRGTHGEQEDLDLLAFSSEPLHAQKQSMAVHGLPLRAVYREGVVGIRYQHPRVVPAGGIPVRIYSTCSPKFELNALSVPRKELSSPPDELPDSHGCSQFCGRHPSCLPVQSEPAASSRTCSCEYSGHQPTACGTHDRKWPS